MFDQQKSFPVVSDWLRASSVQDPGSEIDVFGDHLIAGVALGVVKIFEKRTGKELYRNNSFDLEWCNPVKMLENVGVLSNDDGMICLIRRGAKDDEWTEEKVSIGVPRIDCLEKGEGSRLVIASAYGIYGICLWDIEERKVVPSKEPVLITTWMLTFHFPHVCVVGGSDWDGLVVLNILTGKQVRHIEVRT